MYLVYHYLSDAPPRASDWGQFAVGARGHQAEGDVYKNVGTGLSYLGLQRKRWEGYEWEDYPVSPHYTEDVRTWAAKGPGYVGVVNGPEDGYEGATLSGEASVMFFAHPGTKHKDEDSGTRGVK